MNKTFRLIKGSAKSLKPSEAIEIIKDFGAEVGIEVTVGPGGFIKIHNTESISGDALVLALLSACTAFGLSVGEVEDALVISDSKEMSAKDALEMQSLLMDALGEGFKSYLGDGFCVMQFSGPEKDMMLKVTEDTAKNFKMEVLNAN